jgi:hypothetical protein
MIVRKASLFTKVLTSGYFRSLSTLSSLLENEDQSVRISSGEASALLFEIRNESQSHCSTNKNEDELVEQVRALALEAGGKGQVNKKVQRSSFKEILAVIEVLSKGVYLSMFTLFSRDVTVCFRVVWLSHRGHEICDYFNHNVLDYLQGGPASGISVKLKQRDVLSLQSWTQIIQVFLVIMCISGFM